MYVYKITNSVDGKMYIGITTRSVEKRWKEHLQHARDMSEDRWQYYLYRAMRKHGIESFSVETVYEAVNLAEAKIFVYGMCPSHISRLMSGDRQIGQRRIS